MTPYASASQGRRVVVTAVIVSHDGRPWLPRLLSSLEDSTRRPDRIVAVDTGSTDESADLLCAALGRHAVVRADRRTAFGAAVQRGIHHADATADTTGDSICGESDHWVWILHDDMAVEPDTLTTLLTAADDPEVAVVGPKVREWPDGKRLRQVGLTITGTARPDPGVDTGEYDQGQHDRAHRVLAVGSAGMLVRRPVWDALGGFDPAFPLFGDDLDFGWRVARTGHHTIVDPDAVVYHAAAAANGSRPVDAMRGGAQRLARKHALLAVLANCRPSAVALVAVRLILGSLLRAIGLLTIRAPRQALDELAAIGSVILRPGRVLGARRRRTVTSSASDVRALLAPWWAPYRRGLDALGQVASEAHGAVTNRRAPLSRGARPGPSLAAVTCFLVLIAVLAPGVDLFGDGLLRGGALLPAPPGIGYWWSLYVESWHPVATGSDIPAPPYVAVLAGFGTLLAGQAWLVVDLLIGFAVPLAALTAYVASGRLVRSLPVRLWAAVSYGLLPVLTGAVAQGRIGTIAATVLAPLAAWPLARTVTAPTPGQRLRAGITAGLMLSVVAAFAPSAWLLTTLVVGGALLARWRSGMDGRTLAGLAAAVVLPVVVLLPWTLHLSVDVSRWLTDVGYVAGVPGMAAASRWDLGLGRPGGFGDAPSWLGAGVVLAAAVALFRSDRRGVVIAAWGVALAALLVVMLQRQHGVWPGFTVAAVHGAAIAAAALGADGAIERLRGASFGWRQPVAVLVATAAVLTPLLGLGWWALADETLVDRREPTVLPAFMADAQLEPAHPRTLVIGADGGSGVTYHLSRGPGMFIGRDAVLEGNPGLAPLVGRLVTDPGAADVAALAAEGVLFVLLSEADDDVAAVIDGAPGLERTSAGESAAAAWRIEVPAGGARLVAGEVDTDIDTEIDSELETGGGRGWWLAVQAGVILLALVLTVAGRRAAGAEEDDR